MIAEGPLPVIKKYEKENYQMLTIRQKQKLIKYVPMMTTSLRSTASGQ